MVAARLLIVVQCVGVCAVGPWRDVATTQGTVRGYLVDHHRNPYYAYRAIIYARANRFQAPRPIRRWDGTFEATYQVTCPQPDGSGTEDCLVVNVFSPDDAGSHPVLVVVHASDFRSGWGAFQPPTRLLAQNFVIVTFNYRLGAFGYLCLGTPEAPGNAGLKDQVAALYWIHKNIAHFGGNPLDVTIYGVESGASSVQLIMLSGAARGLFHKAIIESGSALSPLSLSYDPLLTAFDAAATIGYAGRENAEELARFYTELSVKSLVNASTLFLPCVERNLDSTHSLIELDPLLTFQQRNYHTVPTLIAYTYMLGASKTESEIFEASLPDDFANLLPNNLKFDNDHTKRRIADLVKEFYFGKHAEDANLLQNYVDYFNDVTFEYPIIKSAGLHAATSFSPTYLMRFSIKDQTKSNLQDDTCCKNILDYFYDKDLDDEDPMIVERLVTLWSNFIKIGDPTPLTTSVVPVVWQPVTTEKDNFNMKSVRGLIFGKTLRVTSKLAHNRIQFWDQIYKQFYRSNAAWSQEDEGS